MPCGTKSGSPCCASSGGIPEVRCSHDIHDDENSQSSFLTRTPHEKSNIDDPWLHKGKRLQALNFPLGGFGTGNILLQGDGSLQGWTIQNQFHNPEYTPLHKLPGNMFAITATWQEDENKPTTQQQTYVLQSDENYSDYNQKIHSREESHVSQYQVQRIQQFPHVPKLEMKCQYPIAIVNYLLPPEFPVDVRLEAMTPLIPTNTKDSSYPLAVFTFTITNRRSDIDITIDLMQSTMNFIGWDGHTNCCQSPTTPFWGQNINTPFVYKPTPSSKNEAVDTNISPDNSDTVYCTGLYFTSQQDIKDVTRRGSIALVGLDDSRQVHGNPTEESSKTISVISTCRSETELYEQFTARKFQDPSKTGGSEPSLSGTSYMGAVVQSVKSIPPKSTITCTFVLCWYFPNRPCTAPRDNLPSDIWGNQYENWFKDAKDVACQFCIVSQNLVNTTRTFVDTLYSSTIPWEVLESAAGRIACMRSPTMFWTKDGIILANEGNDCCPLNCTHVWGYTTLLERLFPYVAKDMRTSDFVRNFDATQQGCTMRFGTGGFAIDGSLASVIKTYLVVQQSDPELEFLRSVWPNVKRQMEMIFTKTLEKDGVIRSAQQNTYDSAMKGANTFIGSYLVTALKATASMAILIGDANYAKKCQKQAEDSSTKYEAICWNDEYGYYVADVNETNCENSYGLGCFIDQVCAIGLSTACGFGYIFNPDHEGRARISIVRNNKVTKPPFQDQQYHFYFGDSGIRICTYPNGRLGKGMPCENLVSSGFTYSLVAGLIYDGNWTDALDVCRMIRARQSGINRSPWNEPECGLYYSRSMAAWNLFDQACGFGYDSAKGTLTFKPKVNAAAFSCFCTFHQGFGRYEQKGDADFSFGDVKLSILYGTLAALNSIQLNSTAHIVEVKLDGKALKASIDVGGIVKFDSTLVLNAGSVVELILSSPCRGKTRSTSLGGHSKFPWKHFEFFGVMLFAIGLFYFLWQIIQQLIEGHHVSALLFVD